MNKIFHITCQSYREELISPRTPVLSTTHGTVYNRIDSRRMNITCVPHILREALIMARLHRMDHFEEKIKLLYGLRHRHMFLWLNLRNVVILLNDITDKLLENVRHPFLILC